MRRQLVSSLLASSALFSGVLLSSPGPVAAAHPGENGRLAYSDYSGIWTVNPDGSDPQRLTTAPEGYEDRTPEWSPGGTHVVFQRGSGIPSDIWIVKADGSDTQELYAEEEWDYLPSFAPDATRLVITSSRPPVEAPLGHPRHDIWTIRLDGSDPRRLTFDAQASGCSSELGHWSPAGNWISFSTFCGVGPARSLDLMRSDGTGRRTLTTRSTGRGHSWSPDGTRIIYPFFQNRVTRIYELNVVTGVERILTERQTFDTGPEFIWPTYSPDGAQIAFLLDVPDDDTFMPAIHLMPATGGQATNIGINAESIAWQPVNDVTFVDARTSPHASSIVWLYEAGYTTGCGIDRFCPTFGLRRGEMASFLSRVLDLPPASADYFTDDEGSIHEEHINRLAEAGITTGCTPDRYCGGDYVRRGPMASFLARAFDLPAATMDHFTDDEGWIYEEDINRIADAGITTGCGDGAYCVRTIVNREQIAAFLERALDPS